MKKTITTTLAAAAFLLTTIAARADEPACIAGRENAAGKYAYCVSKAKVTSLTDTTKAEAAFAKCRIKYDATWEKSKIKNPGTTCDTAARFENGPGGMIDHLTGLVWEQKDAGSDGVPNPSSPHDLDNLYSWTDGDADNTDGDGTAFTSFLADLNSGGGYGGANGWRLPTVQELLTILSPENPCEAFPCVVPQLLPSLGGVYWSGSTRSISPTLAWVVNTSNGTVGGTSGKNVDVYVRAVRSGR